MIESRNGRRVVPDFDPRTWGMSKVEARRPDRFAQFAIAAAAQALMDAGLATDVTASGGLSDVDPNRIGVLIGTGIGGALSWERQALLRHEKGDRAVSPLTIPMVMPMRSPIRSALAGTTARWCLCPRPGELRRCPGP
jgi:3-oxoacyl-[acyl-carrier-protein] synthase II